jgi:hypothetical protein
MLNLICILTHECDCEKFKKKRGKSQKRERENAWLKKG